jgi:tetratricopeptide (TPR) repeat protein
MAALADCDQALKLTPDNVEAHINRGAVRQARGDLDGALADFNRAIALDPRAAAWNNRGRVWMLKDDLTRSLADLNHAIERDPKLTVRTRSRRFLKL